MDLLLFLIRPGHAVSVFLSELKRVMTNFTQRGSCVSTVQVIFINQLSTILFTLKQIDTSFIIENFEYHRTSTTNTHQNRLTDYLLQVDNGLSYCIFKL